MSKTPNTDKKTVKEPRKLKQGRYQSFRLQKPIKSAEPSVPSAFRIFFGSLGIIKRNWKPFAGIVAVYCIFNLLLVQSFNGADINQTKDNLDSMNSGPFGGLLSSAALFVYLASSSGNVNSSTAGAYQLVLTVLTSLALIWTLRQVYAGEKVHTRDAFYWGMYPLVPFVLVMATAVLQLLPVVVGGYIYNLVTQGISATPIEATIWTILLALLALISLYMLASSLFALYIVCLPNVTPGDALKSARELVRYRRWMVMRKVIFLPICLLVVAASVIVPLIFVAPVVAGVIFLLTSSFGLPIIHSYMYRLYRELL